MFTASLPLVAELVGVAEIAQLVGVSRQRVNEIVRTDPDFPPPEAELAAGRIWERGKVDAWMAARSRQSKGAHVREIQGVTIVSPVEFGDAQLVADTFTDGRPVVVELRQCDVMLQRRLIDFSSGVAYGLKGVMDKVADQAYLLLPKGTSVSAKKRSAIAEAL